MRKRYFAAAFGMLMAAGCAANGGGGAPNIPRALNFTGSSSTGYVVSVLQSLGGTNSAANSLNDNGEPAGTSFLSGNTAMHAALWRDAGVVDLGTLGGPNSAVEWPVLNDDGFVSGISETSRTDPLGESTQWSCHAFLPDGGSSGKTCLAFVWHNGKMRPLGTLGGNNGYGAGMNQRDEIVGWAETSKHDSTCVAPQVLQFLPARWNALERKARALATLRVNGKLDPDGAATAVNRDGDVVGISGICDVAVGRFTAHHAVLWKDGGRATQLKTLGGVSWNTPTAINDDGQIVGFLNRPGSADKKGAPNFISVIWTDPASKPTKIGVLPGDQLSEPTSINNRGVVLGVSFPSSHVFLWQNGRMTDFTKIVEAAYPNLEPVSVGGINDRGEIAGQACELVSGSCPSSGATFVTFLAAPN
ncbi:MAG: hypothetical protein JO078_11595 [Candidatus Eremiobacteraeota bacterium]|nr:hypothetical protein [Candidatus Eremiobacteraeota bacterium]MBV9057449.1 hypothetical protein [Candidatus Eremiobacteraeota bacterium]MBV9700753.1 hypothetical protein [Candidatus Eremiobacteraeota bacterium]